MNEMLLILALHGSTWQMSEEGLPMLCLRDVVSPSETTSQETKVCTKVPEELLLKWLTKATVRV